LWFRRTLGRKTQASVASPVARGGTASVAPYKLNAIGRRKFSLKESNGSRQVKIAGADHHHLGRENELVAVIDAFLRERK